MHTLTLTEAQRLQGRSRCPACGGFIMIDDDELRCLACGRHVAAVVSTQQMPRVAAARYSTATRGRPLSSGRQ